jgi:Fur family transcriptional regulator, ferric uptake regulator
MDNKTILNRILKDKGYSLTSQRVKVFEYLLSMKEPITITDLANRVNEVDRVSIYRIVELFEEVGIVHRVWTGFKSKIELSEEFSPHHHHFSCLTCGKTISLNSEVLEENLKSFEMEYGFELTQHTVELSGFCSKCKTNALNTKNTRNLIH